MVRSDSREYFTQHESEDEGNKRTFTSNKKKTKNNNSSNKKHPHHRSKEKEKATGQKQKQKQTRTDYHINEGTYGNIFITPANSSSSHKYRTPFPSGSCQNSNETFTYNLMENINANDDEDCVQPSKYHQRKENFQCEMTPRKKTQTQRVSITPPLRKSPRNQNHPHTRRRSRSLSIHIRPLIGDPTDRSIEISKCQSTRNRDQPKTRKCRKHIHNLSFEDCEDCKFKDDCWKKSQVAKSPCHSTWGPAYRPPPSNCPSNSSQGQHQYKYKNNCDYSPQNRVEIKSPQSCSSSSSSSENSPGLCFSPQSNRNRSRNLENYGKTRACPVYQPEISSRPSRAADSNLIELDGEIIPYQVAQNLQEDQKIQNQSQSLSQSRATGINTKSNSKSKTEAQSQKRDDKKPSVDQIEFWVDGNPESQAFFENEKKSQNHLPFSQQDEDPQQVEKEPEPQEEKRKTAQNNEDFLSKKILPTTARNSNSGNYDQDVHFANIQDLPKPEDVRKMNHHHHHSKNHQHHHDKYADDQYSSHHSECDSEGENQHGNKKHKHHHQHHHHHHGNSDSCSKRPHKSRHSPNHHHHHEKHSNSGVGPTANVFPFRKSPSGNLKILHNQVAFQSKQVAVLVNDPRRTRVQLKQDRFRDCGPGDFKHSGFHEKSDSKRYRDSDFNANDQNRNRNSDCCYSSKSGPPPIPPFCSDDHESPPSPPKSSRRCSGGNPNHDFSQSQTCEVKQSPRSCSKPRCRSRSKSKSKSRSREKSACKKEEVDQTLIENCCRVCPAKETRTETVTLAAAESEDEIPFWESQTQNQCRNSGDFHECLHYRLRRAIHPDTKIVIGTKEFPCHSIALQAYSKYFDSIKRPADSMHRIHLPKEIISAEDFPNLMDWILHNEACKPLVISKENVVALYSAAKCLGIPGLEEHCLSFINEKIESCDPLILQLYDDARRKKKCKELLCSLSSKLAHLFPLLYKSRQFLSLGPEELIRLIDSDQVKIQSELDIYDAAARWLLYDWENRREFAVRVMKCVRFGLLSPLQLTQIRHCADASNMPDYSHIYSFPEIKEMLCDGLTYAIFKECYKTRPGELNKWIKWSKVQAPKCRYNADGNPDLFRMPVRVPVDGYPIYDGDTKETCRKNTPRNEKSYPHDQSPTNEDCAVRDQNQTQIQCKGKGQISSPRKPETGEKYGNASWRQSQRPSKPRSSSASPRALNGNEKDKRRSFPSESSYTSPFSSTNEKNSHGDTSEASNSHDNNRDMKNGKNQYCAGAGFEQIVENPSQNFDLTLDLDALLDTCLNPNPNSGRRDKSQNASKKLQETHTKTFDHNNNPNENTNAITIQADPLENCGNYGKLPPKSPRTITKTTTKRRREETFGSSGNFGKIHEQAATKIQAHYRGHLIRRHYLEMKAAATTIQKQYRSYQNHNQYQNPNERQNRRHHKSETNSKKTVIRERVRRLSIADKDVVVVFGGMNPQEELSSSNNCQSIYRFNPEENLWAEMGKIPEPRSHCGVVYDRERIFVFGGTDPRKQTDQGKNIPSSSCWSLDPNPTTGTGKWRVMASMKIPRANFGYCKFRGKIYVFGGKDESGQALSSCEKFDPSFGQSGAWELISPMQKPCMSMAVAKFGDKIFVVGGVSMNNQKSKSPDTTTSGKRPISKTVVVYEPATNSWSYRTPLKFGRCYSQLVSHYNQLFLVGGAGKENNGDRTKSLQDVTVFEDGEWETVGRLKRARHGHALVKIGKHLLIMGGVSSESMEPLDTVEIFNIETNRASSKVSSMPRKLTGMAAIVI